jgi:hypothetical protein
MTEAEFVHVVAGVQAVCREHAVRSVVRRAA